MSSSHALIVIQRVRTAWTKASRGGTNAAARNRTPDAFEISALSLPFPDDVFLLHKLTYTEGDCFQHPRERLEQKKRTDSFHYDCLKISLRNNTLRAMLEWERSWGAPRRFAYPRKEFFLQEGQWLRIMYNLRTTWEGWGYEKRVLNIAFAIPSARMFLETKPAYRYVDMAQLLY